MLIDTPDYARIFPPITTLSLVLVVFGLVYNSVWSNMVKPFLPSAFLLSLAPPSSEMARSFQTLGTSKGLTLQAIPFEIHHLIRVTSD